VEEHDVLRSSIAQAQTEKQHTAKRLANLERAVKAMAELIQVMAAANAEDRLARLENRMDHVWANVEV
jgi:tetrahydromethanopterin S-methyltransferase subunit G